MYYYVVHALTTVHEKSPRIDKRRGGERHRARGEREERHLLDKPSSLLVFRKSSSMET